MYKRLIGLGALILFITGMFTTGCTRYASKELLAQMEQTCQAADEAEAKVAQLQSELEGLKAEKAKKEARIKELQERIKDLESRKPTR